MKVFILLLSIFFNIKCDYKNMDCDNNKSNDNIKNINILSISYELTYSNSSVLKAIIRTVDDITTEIKFNARLKSEIGKREYKLSCINSSENFIDCYSEKVEFNLSDKYYLYYKKGEDDVYTIDEQDILEDYKKVSLIFKPEIYKDQTLYKDNRKVVGLNNGKIIGGGYVYIVPKSKKILHKTSDGFNKFIDLNNYIYHNGLNGLGPVCTLISYKEAIKRGYHIVDAEIQFTKDKIPVICIEKNLEKISNGNGKIESKTLEELQKLDFGNKYGKKYANERILTFDELLKFCRQNNVIIDLDFIKNFENTDEYFEIIINLVEKNNMFNSIIFNINVDSNENIISKLQNIKNNIAISVSNANKKEDINKFKNFKRVIYNIGKISKKSNITDKLKYFKSLGNKIKVDVVDNFKFANKLQSLGVNYIKTNKLHPFVIRNIREDPLVVKCTQFDILVNCNISEEIDLVDNRVYDVYYSDNIYNKSEDIIDRPIGEFKYVDTKEYDSYYYNIREFDFEKGILKIKSSMEIDKGQQVKGKIGPARYVNYAPDCYQYNFICYGNDSYYLDCKIFKDEDKVKFEGNYSIYSIVNYSYTLNIKENDINTKPLEAPEEPKKNSNKIFYFSIIFFVIITLFVIIYAVLKRIEKKDQYKKIKVIENS